MTHGGGHYVDKITSSFDELLLAFEEKLQVLIK